jgi:hypothetical protein
MRKVITACFSPTSTYRGDADLLATSNRVRAIQLWCIACERGMPGPLLRAIILH